MFLRFSMIVFVFLFLLSCGSDMKEIEYIIEEEQLEYEEALDVSMIYSDSAIVRVNVEAPRMLRHLDRDEPRQEFLDGVKITFYGPNKKAQSVLTSKYAMRYDKKNEIEIRDSVIWLNNSGERLETEELIWEERKERVSSNRLVIITKPDEIIYGYGGFEANQEFTEWTIKAAEGEFIKPLKDKE